MAIVTIKKDYQIQIPEDLRKKMVLNEGEKLILEVDKKGKIIIGKFTKSPVDESFGIWADEKDGMAYVNRIRDEEEERLKEVGIERSFD